MAMRTKREQRESKVEARVYEDKNATSPDRRPGSGQAEGHSALRLEVTEGIARLTIDTPTAKVNLLTPQVMLELARLVEELSTRRDLRCLVVKSAKPGIFIAGADIKMIAKIAEEEEAEKESRAGQEVFNRLEDLPFPSVAVIDGAAAGGGLELALACTYRLATDGPKTRIGLPETGLGIIPGFGGTYRLPRSVGLVQAISMIAGGSLVDGVRAAKIKLVDACYPQAFIDDRTAEFVERLLAGPGRAEVARRRRRKPLALRFIEGNPIGRVLLFRRARRDILRRTGGHYPAPLAALKVIRRTVHASRERALKAERAAFARLAPTPVSKNLVNLFFAREAAKHPPRVKAGGRSDATPARSVRSAAVLGAGVMGGRIAWLFTKYDIPVVMKDIAWPAVQKGYASALGVYRELERKRRYDRREINLKMHRLSGTLDYGSMMRPDIVIEAVVENLKVKKQVLAEVESHVAADSIIVSNTSSLSIDEMAAALEHPERFAGMHFFNPPNRMPLVEVIPGAKTDERAVRAVVELALALGKTPIVVKNCPGFLVNRLLMPYLNEASHMVGEGVDYLRIDRLIHAFGMPMGPFTLLDEVGIDVAIEVSEVLAAAYAERMQAAMIFEAFEGRKDLLGKKSGRGFYLHDGKKDRPNPEMRKLLRASGVPRAAHLSDDVIVHRPIFALLNEAARALDEGVAASGRELDLALILGTGFPPFRGGILTYADRLGLGAVKTRLERYAAVYGSRFEPAPLIERLAAERASIAGFVPEFD